MEEGRYQTEAVRSHVAELLRGPDRLRRIVTELDMVDRDIQNWHADRQGLEYAKNFRAALRSAITSIGRAKV